MSFTYMHLAANYYKHRSMDVFEEAVQNDVSKEIIKKAISFIEESGDSVDHLKKWFRETFYRESRGRVAVGIGENRDYKVQQDSNGRGLWIQLPVNTLGTIKGDRVRAQFRNGFIVVYPPDLKSQSDKKGVYYFSRRGDKFYISAYFETVDQAKESLETVKSVCGHPFQQGSERVFAEIPQDKLGPAIAEMESRGLEYDPTGI